MVTNGSISGLSSSITSGNGGYSTNNYDADQSLITSDRASSNANEESRTPHYSFEDTSDSESTTSLDDVEAAAVIAEARKKRREKKSKKRGAATTTTASRNTSSADRYPTKTAAGAVQYRAQIKKEYLIFGIIALVTIGLAIFAIVLMTGGVGKSAETSALSFGYLTASPTPYPGWTMMPTSASTEEDFVDSSIESVPKETPPRRTVCNEHTGLFKYFEDDGSITTTNCLKIALSSDNNEITCQRLVVLGGGNVVTDMCPLACGECAPTSSPTHHPTSKPTRRPTAQVTRKPTAPAIVPVRAPVPLPTRVPTVAVPVPTQPVSTQPVPKPTSKPFQIYVGIYVDCEWVTKYADKTVIRCDKTTVSGNSVKKYCPIECGYSPPAPAPVSAKPQPLGNHDTFSFYVMGDVPYEAREEALLAQQLKDINDGIASDDAEFIVHVGDVFKTGVKPCIPLSYQSVANSFRANSPLPVIVLPGDNDIQDCADPAQAQIHWENTFMGFEKNWNQRDLQVIRQNSHPENFSFMIRDLLFVGLHIIAAGGGAEEKERYSECWNWIEQQINNNVSRRLRSIVFFGHADKYNSLFQHAKDTLDKYDVDIPVMYIHGNGHTWEYKKPLEKWNGYVRIQVDKGGDAPPIKVTVQGNNLESRSQPIFASGKYEHMHDFIKVDRQGGPYAGN